MNRHSWKPPPNTQRTCTVNYLTMARLAKREDISCAWLFFFFRNLSLLLLWSIIIIIPEIYLSVYASKGEMEKCSSGWWCWYTKNAWLLMFVKLFFISNKFTLAHAIMSFSYYPFFFIGIILFFCEVKRAQPPSNININ